MGHPGQAGREPHAGGLGGPGRRPSAGPDHPATEQAHRRTRDERTEVSTAGGQAKQATPRRAHRRGGRPGRGRRIGAGGPGSAALAQSGTASITDWINVTQAPYNADNTGTNDATAAINKALSDAGKASLYPNGAVVYLPVGTYLTSAPLSVPHAVTLRGATPMNHSADGQTQDWGSVIKPSPSGTIKAWTNGTNVNGAISIDGTSATLSRMAIEDVWIDGSSLPSFGSTPTVDGIAGTGAVEALTIRGVGIYLVTGNGIAAYSPSTAAPDGWLIEDSVVQGQNTGTGTTYTQWGVTFDCSDSYLGNVHVQQCTYRVLDHRRQQPADRLPRRLEQERQRLHRQRAAERQVLRQHPTGRLREPG